jgi:uncharacterized protein
MIGAQSKEELGMNEATTREIVTRWFDALGAGDVKTAMACLDDNVRWINSPGADGKIGGVPGLSAIVPWFGDFSNKAEVMATFGPYGESQETLQYERLNMMFKDDQALVLVREVARIKATNMTYDIEFVQRYQVTDGRIVLLRAYLDTCRIVAAFRGDMPARLLSAARQGDTAVADQVLPFGANPNQVDPASAESVLMMAAEKDHIAMVLLLISYGAEPNLISRKSGNTALHNACRTGAAQSIKALLNAGAMVNIQRPTSGETPLHEALKNGFAACAEILLDAGAAKNVIAFDGKRPVDVASEMLGPDAPIIARLN